MISNLKVLLQGNNDSSSSFCCCYRIARLSNLDPVFIIKANKYALGIVLQGTFSKVSEYGSTVVFINMGFTKLPLLDHHFNTQSPVVQSCCFSYRVFQIKLQTYPLQRRYRSIWRASLSNLLDKVSYR